MSRKTNKKAENAWLPDGESLEEYERLLMRTIEHRTGAEFSMFLFPQVRTCAQCWLMLNKVHNALMDEKTLVDTMEGYNGQAKKEPNPLLPYFLKLQAELRLQFEALGLNYRATPSKIKEDTRKGVSDDDPMAEFYKGRK